jgi:hypothetical protein
MLGGIGFLSGGSRVIVPNIIGLSTSAASAALSNVGLVLGSSTGSTSSGATSENNGYVASQSVSAGSDLDRTSTITYTTYSYTPPVSPPTWIDSAISNSFQFGTAYSDSVSATNGAGYTWEYVNSGNGASTNAYWVQGVTINSSTGQITGTPTISGQVYSFRIVAYNASGTIYSSTYAGTVASSGSGPNISLAVNFNTPSSSTQLSGIVTGDNFSTGGSFSVSISTTAGSVSPTSFVVPGYSEVIQPFTITGLSAGQTATVTVSSNGVTASDTATTTSAPTVTYRFASSGSNYPLPMSGEVISSQGVIEGTGPMIGTTVYVNAGNCGSNGIQIYAPQFYYWRCFAYDGT